ncbi:erythromycin esterase family protein [Actinomadura viridis]|uniref:erythromycin esterase family protein n=1 Tax=Actinomadura viridis TaxID=58110 RepID=UPI0036B977E9
MADHDLSGWVREHTTTLTGLAPDAPLDDLEPLRDIAGDARVVALGEGAHFVQEFTRARQRLLRFLAERCGFTVLAFEYGFSEAVGLDRWIRDEGGDLARLGGTPFAGLTTEMAHWLHRHNRAGGHPVRFAGIDIPAAGGDLRPALDPVAAYLREVDPDALPLIDRVLAIADRFAGKSFAAASPKWSRLTTAEQDALTAGLARLLLRFQALEALYVSRSDQDRYDLNLRRLQAAPHTDYMFGAMRDIYAGEGMAGDTSIREDYMAGSLLWHLDRAPEDRFVLAAHNNHIQKAPVHFDGDLIAFPMGHYLHRALGDGYRAIALTHTADHVPEMHLDETTEAGFTVIDETLAPPSPGSIEAALIDAGFQDAITLTDLRPVPPEGPRPLDRIRTQSADIELPVREAFDAVLSVPTVTTSTDA